MWRCCIFHARDPADLDGAFAAMAKEGVDALSVIEDVVLIASFKRIAELGGQAAPSLDQLPRVCRRGGTLRLRRELSRALSPRRRFRGQDPQRRQARRHPGRASDDVRIRDQHEDGQGARPCHFIGDPAARGPGVCRHAVAPRGAAPSICCRHLARIARFFRVELAQLPDVVQRELAVAGLGREEREPDRMSRSYGSRFNAASSTPTPRCSAPRRSAPPRRRRRSARFRRELRRLARSSFRPSAVCFCRTSARPSA